MIAAFPVLPAVGPLKTALVGRDVDVVSPETVVSIPLMLVADPILALLSDTLGDSILPILVAVALLCCPLAALEPDALDPIGCPRVGITDPPVATAVMVYPPTTTRETDCELRTCVCPFTTAVAPFVARETA